MRTQPLVQAFLSLLAVTAVAGGGWLLWSQHQQQTRTVQHLQQSQAALQQKDEMLLTLQDEQQRLAEAYDTLKARWTQSDQQVKTLTDTAAQRAKETDALSRTRTSLEQQLQEQRASQSALQQQLETLRRDVTTKAAESAALSQRVKELDKRAMTEAELEQLAQMLEEGEKRQLFLKERILEISNAYEVLARKQPSAAAPAAEAGGQAQAPPPAPLGPSASQRAQQRKAADLQRQLGEIYLAAYQFDKAAEAFELSLQHYDDPNVHAQLAFLYTRFLHNQTQANRHVALAIGVEPATRALDPVAQARGLPRDDERLVWKWFIQDDSPNARATGK